MILSNFDLVALDMCIGFTPNICFPFLFLTCNTFSVANRWFLIKYFPKDTYSGLLLKY